VRRFDFRFYSHKYGKAGLNYELGILLSESKLVWMNGPFMAGGNDKSVLTKKGLKKKLKAIKKKGIGDAGYFGQQGVIACPNPHNDKKVAKFKSRALKRHETFNGRTKLFDCLSGRFRHSVDRFKNCFEAVCVIVFIIMFGIIIFVILIVTTTTIITTKVTCCQNQSRDIPCRHRNRHRLVVRHMLSKIREECFPGEPPHRQFVGSFSLVWLAQ
jgi:hypothetical protein